MASGTASASGMGQLPGDRDGLRLDQDVHPQVGVRISRVCGLAGLPGLFQALSNGLKNKTCFPLASFLAAFQPQRRSGCLSRVGSEQVDCIRGEKRLSMILAEYGLQRRSLHTPETKLKGGSRITDRKRKLLVNPQICRVSNGLLHSKHY